MIDTYELVCIGGGGSDLNIVFHPHLNLSFTSGKCTATWKALGECAHCYDTNLLVFEYYWDLCKSLPLPFTLD